jgi:HD-GYP domain-containing protein (c-di-GMP phosphodiesterase class II)
MTDTKEILKRIAALRVRLDQAQTNVAVCDSPGDERIVARQDIVRLEEKVRDGGRHNAAIDDALRPMDGTATLAMPPKLTARGARVLQRGRDLLYQLRDMLEDPLLQADDHDPLTTLHVEIASMLDVHLRTVQAFPHSASAQIRLCGGLEASQRLIEERLMILHAALAHRRREIGRVDNLADIFHKLAAGQTINPQLILTMAEEIAREARSNKPLRFLHAAADNPARFAAAHGVTVAQVVGRLLCDDPDWTKRLEEALFAALVHDVGMARVPAEILAQPGPLTDDQRRVMERHANAGAQIVGDIMPGGGIFVEGAADHHERLDGTGYPAGKRESQLSPFARMLSICDVYAAMPARRSYRAAKDTRTALADTLLMADQGALDRTYAEKLLSLSFYPVGSVVELNDGSEACVMATHAGRQGIDNPGKPILSLLTGPGGQALALPATVDLIHDGRAIVRAVPAGRRGTLLLGRYPELI